MQIFTLAKKNQQNRLFETISQIALFNIFEKNIYNVIKTNLSRIYSSEV